LISKHVIFTGKHSALTNKRLAGLIIPLAGLIILLITGLVISLADADQVLFIHINKLAQHLPDMIWTNITNMGSTLVGAVLISLLWHKYPHLVLHGIITGTLCTLCVYGLKIGLDITRPHLALDHQLFHFITTDINSPARPSGHTATAFFVAGTWLTLIHSRPIQALILILASLIALSRIAIGVHWPLDLIWGAVIGLGMGVVGPGIIHQMIPSGPKAEGFYRTLGSVLCLLLAYYFYLRPLPYPDTNTASYSLIYALLGYSLGRLGYRLIKKR